jgi:hypothetical protein
MEIRHGQANAVTTAREPQTPKLPEIIGLSDEEARALFDRQARKYLGMSGEEFLRKWDAGEFDDPDQTNIVRVVLMIPLMGRPITLPQ